MINWGKLVTQGRAKAPGVSWTEEEAKAVALLCQTFKKEMSEVARYVREGILTVEAFKKAQGEPGVVNPFLELSKEDLLKKAQELGLAVTPEATKEMLAQMILDKKQEQATQVKKVEEAPIKPEPAPKAKPEKPKAPVKKKPASKPKAKPAKKAGKRK